MYHPFSVSETLKTSWDIFKRNFATIIVFMVLSLLAIIFCAFWVYYFWDESFIGVVCAFLLLVAITYTFLAFIKLLFQLMDNAYYEIRFKDVIPNLKMVGSYLILLLLVSTVMVFLSNSIKNLPDGVTKNILGIAVGYLFQFFTLFYFPLCNCFIVDDQSGPFESVAQSFGLIKGNIIKYFSLFIIIEVLIFIGSLTFVGIIFVIPFVNIILAVTYRKLIYSHQDVDDDVAETN
jgi:uncharacterized membrane protein